MLSIYDIVCGSVGAFCLGSRLLFAAWRQTGRLAMCSVSIPPGRDRHSCVLAALFGYLPWMVHFGLGCFLQVLSTGCRGRGERGWRRGLCAFLRRRIGFAAFSAGSTLGLNVEAALRPPQTAPKSRMWKRHCRLSGLSSRCGGVVLVQIPIPAKSTNAPITALTLAKPGYTERPDRF